MLAALKMSPRFLGDGVRQAAEEIFNSPLFEEARTLHELEAASARFGKALGGTGFRVMVLVATMGLGRLLPAGSDGGISRQARSWVAAMESGPAAEAVATAQVVADGTLVVTGTSAGIAVSSACSGMGLCTMASSSTGSPTALSTDPTPLRYVLTVYGTTPTMSPIPMT